MTQLWRRGPSGPQRVDLFTRAYNGYRAVNLAIAGQQSDPPPVVPDPPAEPPTEPPATEPVGTPIERLLSGDPWYVAHRLGGQEYPEYTRAGMEACLAAGFKAFEVSVYRSSDGVFVCSHDWTTERTAGVRHEIWATSWETIQGLSQPGGAYTRLEDVVAMLPPDGVLFLDMKMTSGEAKPNQWNVGFETDLFNLLETLFDKPQERVVWKVFAEATSAERARAKGYQVCCMLYPTTLEGADLNRWDILGMEWHAPVDAWNTVNAAGKPTIGHIIYDAGQAQQARARGADGLMSTVPSLVHP